MDVDSIEPGMDFLAVLNRHLEKCDVVLAIIGPRWLNAQDSQGRRRIDDEADFVRMEIATALSREIRVIPILVDGASHISAADLPDDLKSLARRQAIEVRHDRFGADAEQLADTLRKVMSPTPAVLVPGLVGPHGRVVGVWRGQLRFAADNILERTWVLQSDGKLVSPHNEFGFVEEGIWALDRDELSVTFPWGTIFRGQVAGRVCRGTSQSETGHGTFEMHKLDDSPC
jgi:hypothetical protein